MNDRDRPESQRRYRYRVEVRDLRDESVRTLPLTALRLVHLTGKRGQSPLPDARVLGVQDDTTVIEAEDLDEPAAKLHHKYPDAIHERRLRWEPDLEAEQRYADALSPLIGFLAKAAVNGILREQPGGADNS